MTIEGEQHIPLPCGCSIYYLPTTGAVISKCEKHRPTKRQLLGSEIHDSNHMARLVRERLGRDYSDITVHELLMETQAMYKEELAREKNMV